MGIFGRVMFVGGQSKGNQIEVLMLAKFTNLDVNKETLK
jgi:hypothetical protein